VEKIFLIAVLVLGVIAINAVLGLLVAFPVMWLWNWLAPTVFHLPLLTYWQAYGLYLLCAILFKSSSSSSSKS
jgi:hypothetical protein